MNQKQLKAIEKFKKAWNNLEKAGLYLFAHESGICVCKIKDINKNVKDSEEGLNAHYGDNWHRIMDVLSRNKAVYLDIYIDNYNT